MSLHQYSTLACVFYPCRLQDVSLSFIIIHPVYLLLKVCVRNHHCLYLIAGNNFLPTLQHFICSSPVAFITLSFMIQLFLSISYFPDQTINFSFSSVLGKCERAESSIWCDSAGCDDETESEKSWKAGKHEHGEKGIGAEWSTDSILAFSISHKPCSHIWIIVSQLNNCYDCYFQFSANYFNLEINYHDLSKMHLKDLQLSATK